MSDKLTTDERMIFFYLLQNPQHLKDAKKLFENNRFKSITYFVSNFFNEYNTVPSTMQLAESVDDINKVSSGKAPWSRQDLDTLFDTQNMNMVDPKWLENQFEIWFNNRSMIVTIQDMINEVKLNEKSKNLKDLVIPFAEKIAKFNGVNGEKLNMFKTLTMNEWMDLAKTKPKPKQLFSSMIFERETTILFGGPNAGKSTLVIQLCESWASGTTIDGFVNECEAQSILYVDFETSESQLYARMHDEEDNVTKKFHENFHRASIVDGEQQFKESLEFHIQKTKCRILVLDNISYLADEAEKGKNSIKLIKDLKHIRDKYNLTVVVLAHTPKIDETLPISMDHLQGSKMLSNLSDSVLGIKRLMTDDNKTYLKQLKVRSAAMEFGYENVCLMGKFKVDGMLCFKLEGNMSEGDITNSDKAEKRNIDRDQKVFQLHKEGKSLRQIEIEMGIGKSTVDRIVKKFGETKKIESAIKAQTDWLTSGNSDEYVGL